jgi:ribosomal-protein-alanine N-acetyltransferase
LSSQFSARRLETEKVKLSIRAAISTDLPDMMALDKRAATAAHWSVEQYEALFGASSPDRMALIIQEETQQSQLQLQGFVIARAVGVEWEIENIAIAGRARRRGLGTRLLGDLLDLARAERAEAVFLEVRESNRAARFLYEKWSFVESGRRKKYYQEPEEDAILYRLGLA